MHWTIHIEGGPRRVNHAAVNVDNLIYSFGGYCTGENYSVQRPIDIHVLDPAIYRWRLLPPSKTEQGQGVTTIESHIPFQRYGHTVVSYERYVYLWGGRNDESGCNGIFRFDTKTQAWEKPEVSGQIPGARNGHSSVVIQEQMFIFGGYEEEVGRCSQEVYSLNLKTLMWSYIPASGLAPSFRDFHTATVYQDRFMFIFGGRGDVHHGPVHTRSEVYCNTLVCLDTKLKEWFIPKTTGTPPRGRRSHSAFVHNGFMYCFGGYNGTFGHHFNDLYRIDLESGVWKYVIPFGNGPVPRRRQGCVVVDNRVFFFGGTSPTPEFDGWNDDSNLVDNNDLCVLAFEPSLRTLCLLKIIESNDAVDVSVLPRDLKAELNSMTMRNLLPASASPGPSNARG